MADIVLDVEVRENTGTGGARDVRRAGGVPGVLYGGSQGPVAISARANAFRKALHSGKFLGHMVTLKYGSETQPVIAKDIQFHPVTEEPVHFDLYRVDVSQAIRISVPVHFRNQEDSPGIKRGGTLNIALHEIEVMAPAGSIPEELVVDLTGLDIGDTIRAADIALPKGVELSSHDREATVASIATSSALQSEEAEAAAEGEAEAEAQ
ncbi:MAG TPA: 50S ribosomal protein L25/general stress protein Ctc [Caulobacteraceae bacterium]|jgi:large subunit ribosomal protein L25|nr:50S ribosomal protein L25/general stress protein Ctc [Caulobacteraceae bacterium]